MLWTKRTHQCTIFPAFQCSNESSPNFSCHFWNRKVRQLYIQILHHCPVSWKITIFLVQTSCTLDKNSPSKWNFWTFEWLGKNSQNSCHICNHKSVFLWILHHSCHERSLFCTFLAETSHDFYKRSPSKCKISDFSLLRWNFTKFVLW